MSDKYKNNKVKYDNEKIKNAHLLSEALPYMQKYGGKSVVIKYGGNAMADSKLSEIFARDILLLKQSGINPVIVHGGGPQISKLLSKLDIKTKFVQGLRFTDRETVDIVEMVLSGSINKQIVHSINRAGGKAIGLSGKDGGLIRAKKLVKKCDNTTSNSEQDDELDLGYVGEPVEINTYIIETIIKSDIVPVIAPVGYCDNGDTYNINADSVAGAIAASLKAKRLLILTDVKGVLDDRGELIEVLSVDDAKELMDSKVIEGGMIPKIKTCIDAVQNGVEAVVIVDGRVPHSILLELLTAHGSGTLIKN